jgi:predicted nuclease with TOPRIM domain
MGMELAQVTQELDLQIQKVRDARKMKADHEDVIQKLNEAFYKEHTNLILSYEVSKDELTNAEAQLRKMVLEAYTLTGNKKPAEGVGIREVRKVLYDPFKAFSRAKDHKTCLELGTKAFEALAKSCDALDIPAEIKIEAQATISKDL